VATAREVVATSGPDVGLEVVAARAGVGIGTLYRHFPRRADLLLAVVEDRLRETAERLRAELDHDPREALAAVVRTFAAAQRADAALARVVRETPVGNGPVDAARAEIGAVLAQVCDRARRAGALRSDVTAADVHALVCAVAAAGPDDPAAGDRYVQVVLDGLTAVR
jgi:AcrR family transcriptional regulator